jgi:hypothetical protein
MSKKSAKGQLRILAIDPGHNGAFVWWDGERVRYEATPLRDPTAKVKEVDFEKICVFLKDRPDHIYLERANSFGMGMKAAFNYGRGFGAIEIAIRLAQIPVTLVEPGKWVKEMTEGVDANLKPKVRAWLAFQRLFPQLIGQVPRTKVTKRNKEGVPHDGVVDAQLMAEFGRRKLGGNSLPPPASVKDF